MRVVRFYDSPISSSSSSFSSASSSAGPQPRPSTPSVPCQTSTTAHNYKHTITNTQSQARNHNHTTTNTNTQPQHTTRGPTSKIENYNIHDHGNMLLTMASRQMIEMSWWGSLEVKSFVARGQSKDVDPPNILRPARMPLLQAALPTTVSGSASNLPWQAAGRD